jgi:thiamine biosynthesis lipoprotein
MGTVFRLRLADLDTRYARQAAAAAFDELHRLEGLWSHFIETSDIARINGLSAGDETVVALETFGCLQLSLQMWRMTGGVFDVSYASSSTGTLPERIRLNSPGCVVRVLTGGVQLDLGGIGKGYALDYLARVLHEWDASGAFLEASRSTVFARQGEAGTAGWPVEFGPPNDRRKRMLRDAALSASGTAVKGNHVHDPRTMSCQPANVRCWALARSAGVADALSTALLVMNDNEARRLCRENPGVEGYAQRRGYDQLVAHP